MVDDREAARRAVAREVLRELRDPIFRDGALVKNATGTHTVIAALEDDTLGYVFGRMKDAGNGPANLVVATKNALTVVSLQPHSKVAVEPVGDYDCPVTAEGHVGMLLDLLNERHGRPVVCRLVESPFTAELTTPPARELV